MLKAASSYQLREDSIKDAASLQKKKKFLVE